MRGHGFPWSKLLMVLLVFAAGFVAHDIRSHGSFTGLLLIQHLPSSCEFFLTAVVCFRFHQCQVSAQLRGHGCISGGLGQNNSLLQTRLQVRRVKYLKRTVQLAKHFTCASVFAFPAAGWRPTLRIITRSVRVFWDLYLNRVWKRPKRWRRSSLRTPRSLSSGSENRRRWS